MNGHMGRTTVSMPSSHLPLAIAPRGAGLRRDRFPPVVGSSPAGVTKNGGRFTLAKKLVSSCPW